MERIYTHEHPDDVERRLNRHAVHDGPCGERLACDRPGCPWAEAGYLTRERLSNGRVVSHCRCQHDELHPHLHPSERDVLSRVR